MKRLRTVSAALIALPLISLAACGGGDTTATTASSAPAVATSAVPGPVAAGGDIAICQAAEVAKKALVATVSAGTDSSGNVPPATAKKALTDLSDALTKMAAAGGSSQLATIAGQVGTEAKKLAATPDPLKADDDAFTKAGNRFDAACKAAGFTTTS